MMVNRMWTTAGDIPCTQRVEPMCGLATCTFRGNVHLAWQMPLQHADQDYFTPGFNLHFVLFYLPSFCLGMYGTTLFLLLSGPFLGRVFTHHQDEIPAIWCFFSIAQVVCPLAYAFIRKQHMFKVTLPTDSMSTLETSALHSNGVHINGHTNGVHTNGHTNGVHTNGHTNGVHTNGHTNGVHTNGHANGVHSNGHTAYTNGVHSNGHVNVRSKAIDDDEPDPIGGVRGIIVKSLILAAFLSLKRYAVIQLQPVQFPDQAGLA